MRYQRHFRMAGRDARSVEGEVEVEGRRAGVVVASSCGLAAGAGGERGFDIANRWVVGIDYGQYALCDIVCQRWIWR